MKFKETLASGLIIYTIYTNDERSKIHKIYSRNLVFWSAKVLKIGYIHNRASGLPLAWKLALPLLQCTFYTMTKYYNTTVPEIGLHKFLSGNVHFILGLSYHYGNTMKSFLLDKNIGHYLGKGTIIIISYALWLLPISLLRFSFSNPHFVIQMWIR